MGVIKIAIADAVITCMWVFCSSALGAITFILASAFGVTQALPTILITTVLFFILLLVFGIIGDAVGGASFNPTGPAAFYAAGVGGPETLVTAAIRFPAQAAGAVWGAIGIMEFMPMQYKHILEGPSLKVDLHAGAIAEGVLTFFMTFAVLVVVLKGPSNLLVKNWLLAVSTVALIVAGSRYTGPSMNPANAYGWAYINSTHKTWEQFYVYWICPFIGAILAAWVYRFLFPPPRPVKQKKA